MTVVVKLDYRLGGSAVKIETTLKTDSGAQQQGRDFCGHLIAEDNSIHPLCTESRCNRGQLRRLRKPNEKP